MECWYCGYHKASSLHLVARCPAFLGTRNACAKLYHEEATGDLFLNLRECTVKTCWVTLDADPSPEGRVRLQIAVARMGLAVLFSPEETLQGVAHWAVQEAAQRQRDQAEWFDSCQPLPSRPVLPLNPPSKINTYDIDRLEAE